MALDWHLEIFDFRRLPVTVPKHFCAGHVVYAEHLFPFLDCPNTTFQMVAILGLTWHQPKATHNVLKPPCPLSVSIKITWLHAMDFNLSKNASLEGFRVACKEQLGLRWGRHQGDSGISGAGPALLSVIAGGSCYPLVPLLSKIPIPQRGSVSSLLGATWPPC